MVRLAHGCGGYGQSACSCWGGEPLSEPVVSPRMREAIAARPHGVKPPRQLPPETPFVRRLQEQSQSRSMLKPTVTQVQQQSQSRAAPVALEPPLLRCLPITQVANAKRRYSMHAPPPRTPAAGSSRVHTPAAGSPRAHTPAAGSPRAHPQPQPPASLSSLQRPVRPFTTPAAPQPAYTTLASFVSSSASQPPFPPPTPAATMPPPPRIAELLEYGALQSPVHLPLPPPTKARGSEQRARPRVASHCTLATVGPWAAEKQTRACGGAEPRTRGG